MLPKKSKKIKYILRDKDTRGTILSIFENMIKNVSIITSNKNTIRSNHYHLQDWHYIYVISGSIHYLYKRLNEKKINYLYVKKGEIIFTPNNEIHTTYFSSNTEMIVANGQDRNKITYEKDLVRYELANLNNVKSIIRQYR